jgi:transcriptional regulator with XRE-family HTH domain
MQKQGDHMGTKRRGPVVARRQLRLALRRARHDESKTQTEVADALDWSPSKLLRIENGQTNPAVSDVIALLSQYPHIEGDRDELLDLAREAKRPTVATQYSDVFSAQFREWLEYEAYANSIRQYEHQYIPGILQTDDYATAVVGSLVEDEQRVSRIVEARVQRSAPLVGSDGPTMEFIIDEAAIRRAVGRQDAQQGYRDTIAQLRYLMRMNTQGRQALGETIEPELNPRVSIQVAPLDMGPYRAMRHPFEIIEFEDEDDAFMMYFEGPESQVIRDRYEDIERYVDRFSDLKKRLPDARETNHHIDFIIKLMQDRTNGINASPVRTG